MRPQRVTEFSNHSDSRAMDCGSTTLPPEQSEQHSQTSQLISEVSEFCVAPAVGQFIRPRIQVIPEVIPR